MLTDIKFTVLQGLALDDPRSLLPNDLGKALLLSGHRHAGWLPEPPPCNSRDHPPGYETIWKGYMALMHQSDAYQRLIRLVQQKRPGYVYNYKLLQSDK